MTDMAKAPIAVAGVFAKVLDLIFSAVGSLPLPFLYGISDVISFLMRRIVGYRKKIVVKNLSGCFPEMSDKELHRTVKDFYSFLADYFVETFRLGCMSEAEIRRRMRFENSEEVNRYLADGRNVTLYLGHYCNWEWMSSIPLHIRASAHCGQIYHPLENRAADAAFLKIRGHFGADSIKMADTLSTLLSWRRENAPSVVGYIADQAPLYTSIHYFADFFGRETAAFTGPERLSRMLDSVVFYCDMSRPRRGEYVCRYVKITDTVSEMPKFALTQRYFDLLEENIRRQPPLWLWSHNRWKRNRDVLVKTFGEEEARKRLNHL